MSKPAIQLGWLDTNIFLHSLLPNDPHYPRCRALVRALQEGRAEGWIDVTVVHELTCTLQRLPGYRDRTRIRAYIERILGIAQIRADDKTALRETLLLWEQRGGFVDIWLATLAGRRNLPVCSVNERDFPADLDNTFRIANLEQEEEGA
jgi:predicted nucleic acid-binding protein